MEHYLFVAVLIAVFWLWHHLATNTAKNTIDSFRQSLDRVEGFSVSYLQQSVDGSGGIAIDTSRAKVCLLRRFNDGYTHRVIDFEKVISASVHEDGETISSAVRSSQIGGAIVGGVLLGGVGAAIGGLSGKRRETSCVSRIELRVVIEDMQLPTHNVIFQATPVPRESPLYRATAERAREWQGRMETVIRQAERKTAERESTAS